MNTLATAKPDFNIDEVRSLVVEHYGLDTGVHELVGERDQNFLLDAGYVFKVANADERPAELDFQHAALLHLESVAPGLPVPRLVRALNGQSVVRVSANARHYLCRCVTALPGEPAASALGSDALRAQLGRLLARLGCGLRGMFHPAAKRVLAWDLQQAPALRKWTRHIATDALRKRVESVLDRYDDEVAALLPTLRAQIIHNDANPDNLLIADGRVAGIIDFGDIVHAPLVCDLAVACAYQLGADPLATIMPLVAAYHETVPLERCEMDILPALIATRLAATLTISSWRASEHEENRDYILGSHAYATEALGRLMAIDNEAMCTALAEVCGLDMQAALVRGVNADRDDEALLPPAQADAELVTRRERALGPVYRLFYDRPLHLVRGRGVWVFDAAGRRYLDAYNNVACVGHSHPAVLAALAAQARRLNTHSRYLHRNIVDYAERLGALLPYADPVCMFCCSGSEANELAYRIALAHTGARGVIVTDHAYHGNTYVTSQLSSADTPPERRDAFVATIEAPDSYRGAQRYGLTGLEKRYLSQVDAAIASLSSRAVSPAALLVDTVFSCDGVIDAPKTFLSGAAARIRAAGGLLIADEVQAGFARTGEAFWGFERHDVVPDIVTLGKPMGNGHPLAGVVCERAIVEPFAANVDYFNTFGGNPVSCAVGMAVLDVIENEQLQANALATGRYLREQLRDRQQRYPWLGDVRGAGLFVGVELVRDPDSLAPATGAARRIVNAMRDRGVLFSATGPRANVLKIRPPLVFDRDHADRFLEEFDLAVAAVGVECFG